MGNYSTGITVNHLCSEKIRKIPKSMTDFFIIYKYDRFRRYSDKITNYSPSIMFMNRPGARVKFK